MQAHRFDKDALIGVYTDAAGAQATAIAGAFETMDRRLERIERVLPDEYAPVNGS